MLLRSLNPALLEGKVLISHDIPIPTGLLSKGIYLTVHSSNH